jgi:LPS export ABC transporter protein LptC
MQSPRISPNFFPQTKGPDFAFNQVQISEVLRGITTWKLQAQNATIDKNSNKTHLTVVKADFFQNKEKVLSLDSQTADLLMEKSDLNLQKATADIFIKDKIVKLNANTINWNSQKQFLTGSGNIIITSGPFEIKGNSFEVNVPVKNIKIMDNCFAKIIIEEI